MTADEFLQRLHAERSDEELRKYQRYFKFGEGEYAEGDTFLGVRMGTVFELAKEFRELPPAELERLLDSDWHEARAGALKVMALQARAKRTTQDRRRELYELYLRRHDRIDNWDLVDLAAADVVGAWLLDKPRDVLDALARSPSLWERRTAIYSTAAFLKQGQLDDTYRLAEVLLHDDEDLIHKAVGGWLRHAGTLDRPRLLAFLDRHAAGMPRTMLRYAIEHLDADQRARYRGLAG
jgi:3-methyladenine DNA glycosylase AlkD